MTDATGDISLGHLEQDIMDILWNECPCCVRTVHERLKTDREIAYTTVMTVMSRLVEKGVLCRERTGKKHVYTACLSRKEMARLATENYLTALFDRFQEDGFQALQEGLSERPDPQREKFCRTMEKISVEK